MSDIAPAVRAKRVRSLIWFALATAITLLLALTALFIRADQGTPSFTSAQAFPALKDSLDQVARVVVKTADATIEAARGADGRWTIPSKGNYPARFENVKTVRSEERRVGKECRL